MPSSDRPYDARRGCGELGRSALLVFAITVALLALFRGRLWPGFGENGDPRAEPRLVAARGELAADERATIELFEAVSPSVVFINTNRLVRGGFLRLEVYETPEGAGSGFLWNGQGHVVTNYHVIRGADTAHVTLADQSRWSARYVGGSREHDLAVLKIDAPAGRLQPVVIGESENLRVGQKVFAIGNPFGLDQTLTTGIISGLERDVATPGGVRLSHLVQTDAAINPGNSGGPLLDSAGRLIGVNTAILSPSGASAGVGFAVPVDTVNRVVTGLLRGESVRAGLGVRLLPTTVAERLRLEGVPILEVLPGSAAERAGLRGMQTSIDDDVVVGDVIVSADGRPIEDAEDLFAVLDEHLPGDEMELGVLRDGERVRVTVTLQEL